MKEKLPYIIIIALCAFILFRPAKVKQVPGEVVRDIITRVDTVRDTIPVPVYTRTVDSVAVPVIVPILGDTIRDTIYLPIEQKVYRDSLYTAYVSGYRAKLDSIEVYNRTNTVTIRERMKPKRWGLGVQAGYGLTGNRASPYIGIGFNYCLFQW